VENEHFIVWMRPAALPTFRKLYAVITEDIPANVDYTIRLDLRFPTSLFGGSKTLVLSTLGWTGGKNWFLGGAFLVVGSLALAMSFVCGFAWCKGRQMGNAEQLVWGRRQ
jgi:hypothetical protein